MNPPATTPEPERARLLVVEDSPIDRFFYGRSLAGFATEFASTGEEALAKLREGGFDLVLLDHGLPGMDGGQVLDAIRRELLMDLPVVVVTGLGSGKHAADLIARGASDYVTKDDLNTPRLASTVALAIERHRLAQQRERAEGELRAQRDELAETLRQLREAQAHLVQSEKMASLGQLVAGVAHEINNPLAYASNNLAVLARDIRHVVDLIDAYRAHFGENLPEELVAAEAAIDLPYTLANLDRLFESTRQGLKRVRGIVASLHDFSRLDEADRKEIDPNEVVRDTLGLVRYAIQQKEITLTVDLGDLPTLACSPGKLNQVVLNILLNAVQAVDVKARIDVRTRFDPGRDEVRYEIADDGPGIPASIRDRIFDPFFTTKAQGVGTGLGLWVGDNIVRAHGGRIEVESEPGRGTTFSVVVPRRGEAR